jgi:hypothetical protein
VHALGIGSVAVSPRLRGRGLFRRLMSEALAWCDERAPITMLYAGTPALYERFGFVNLAQHSFVGSAPERGPKLPARQFALDDEADKRVMASLVDGRTPVSLHCALKADWPLFLRNLAADDDLKITFVPALSTLVIHEDYEGDVVIVDVVASDMPSLKSVLDAIGRPAGAVRVLFPPDRLAWNGITVPEQTGLMIRGAVPDAMKQPFMFPPTVEF